MKDLALRVVNTLCSYGIEAFLIGGSVRTELHNKFHGDNLSIKDYDITTETSYENVLNMFKNVDTRGEQFKVAVVKMQNIEFEVAQFRGELYPEEGSLRPDVVYAVKTLKEDVMRRDFTMNGIAEDLSGNTIDHVNGIEDIKNKIIRAIGDPNQRFAEDPLRMLRAIRFVSQLGYDIEEKTKEGIANNLYRLSRIPHERVKEEINKLLKGKYVHKAMAMMKELEMYKYSFYNSILKKEVKLFDVIFTTSDSDYKTSLFYLINNQKMSLTDIYFVLYMNASYEKTESELNNMMLLNNEDIFKVMLMLKHSHIARIQEPSALYFLVQDIGEQRGMEYLNDVVDSYSLIFDRELRIVKSFFNRPLFKFQLPFNGNDVMIEGRKLGITQKGKWIGQILDLAQKKATLGQSINLTEIVDEYKRERLENEAY